MIALGSFNFAMTAFNTSAFTTMDLSLTGSIAVAFFAVTTPVVLGFVPFLTGAGFGLLTAFAFAPFVIAAFLTGVLTATFFAVTFGALFLTTIFFGVAFFAFPFAGPDFFTDTVTFLTFAATIFLAFTTFFAFGAGFFFVVFFFVAAILTSLK